MSFTAKDVQSLRQSTGAGMMDCKKALENNNGDIEEAKQWLREKGLAASAKRDDRDNNQGVVALVVANNVGAIVKLKHFNPDLTGWEEKDGMVTFRLLAAEPCALYFNALTYRCDADGGMVVAVRMKSDKPEPQELVFRFRKHGAD